MDEIPKIEPREQESPEHVYHQGELYERSLTKELLKQHRGLSLINCPENCFCWDMDSYFCEQEKNEDSQNVQEASHE